MQRIDFLATQAHYIDHIAPIWDVLDEHCGSFYVPQGLIGYAHSRLKRNFFIFPYESDSLETFTDNPMLVCAYGDMKYVHRMQPNRRIFMMEHGTGHSFGTSAYPNGPGERDCVSLFLAPNTYTALKIRSARSTPVEVIGTPKMDWTAHREFPLTEGEEEPIVCISFHHGSKSRKPPEAGSAFEHYKDLVPELKKHFRLVAHGHPLSRVRDIAFFDSVGVPFLHHFNEVLNIASVYVNDLSSTLYEFITTKRPVVVLNAPWFRREVEHGIRFWDYSNIGPQVDEPEQLIHTIKSVLQYPLLRVEERAQAVRDLYPYHGYSAGRAAAVIRRHLLQEEHHERDRSVL